MRMVAEFKMCSEDIREMLKINRGIWGIRKMRLAISREGRSHTHTDMLVVQDDAIDLVLEQARFSISQLRAAVLNRSGSDWEEISVFYGQFIEDLNTVVWG